MNESLVEQAALNNAEWCEAVFRSHGRPGQFLEDIWLNRHPAPPFYGNAVTLSRTGLSGQIACVDDLRRDLSGRWAVKDSFHCLELAPLGFRVLFDASWLFRPSLATTAASPLEGVTWSTVRDPLRLAQWEAAWRRDSMNSLASSAPPVFLPQLTKDEHVAFIAVHEKDEIVAGAIGNLTGAVAGISNMFFPAGRSDLRAGLVEAVQHTYPGTAIVGYERSADEIEAHKRLGFRLLAPLRVWVCDAP